MIGPTGGKNGVELYAPKSFTFKNFSLPEAYAKPGFLFIPANELRREALFEHNYCVSSFPPLNTQYI
jgi:hypothetical protein